MGRILDLRHASEQDRTTEVVSGLGIQKTGEALARRVVEEVVLGHHSDAVIDELAVASLADDERDKLRHGGAHTAALVICRHDRAALIAVGDAQFGSEVDIVVIELFVRVALNVHRHPVKHGLRAILGKEDDTTDLLGGLRLPSEGRRLLAEELVSVPTHGQCCHDCIQASTLAHQSAT